MLPAHAPLDGDTIFAASTGLRPLREPVQELTELGHAATLVMARAIARGRGPGCRSPGCLERSRPGATVSLVGMSDNSTGAAAGACADPRARHRRHAFAPAVTAAAAVLLAGCLDGFGYRHLYYPLLQFWGAPPFRVPFSRHACVTSAIECHRLGFEDHAG